MDKISIVSDMARLSLWGSRGPGRRRKNHQSVEISTGNIELVNKLFTDVYYNINIIYTMIDRVSRISYTTNDDAIRARRPNQDVTSTFMARCRCCKG